MKAKLRLLTLFLALAFLLSACNSASPQQPNPTPEPVATVEPATGNVAMLAEKLSAALGIPINPGQMGSEDATGVEAAQLVVSALGLDTQIRLQSPGIILESADYLEIAIENNVADAGFFTPETMTEAQMDDFVAAVVKAYEGGVSPFIPYQEGMAVQVDALLDAACQIAVIAYNPLAQDQGVFRFGDSQTAEKLGYWTMATMGTLTREGAQSVQDALSFCTLDESGKNPQFYADEVLLRQMITEVWGVTLPTKVDGLTFTDSKAYVGGVTQDSVRQVPSVYRADQVGKYVRCMVNVFNGEQWAGRTTVWLNKNSDTLLGWQVIAIEPGTTTPIYFVAVAENPGTKAEALIDDSLQSVWVLDDKVENPILTLQFAEPTTISGLCLYNGDHSIDQKALNQSGFVGQVGIRFDGDSKDVLRYDFTPGKAGQVIGEHIALPLGELVTTTQVQLVFYGKTPQPISISGISAF